MYRFKVRLPSHECANSLVRPALSLTCVDVSLCRQAVLPLSNVSCSCRHALSMNTAYFFTAGELPLLPIDGMFHTGSQSMQPLILSFIVFTILRTFALLQDYSFKFAATLILSALTLVVFTLDSVRVRSSKQT